VEITFDGLTVAVVRALLLAVADVALEPVRAGRLHIAAAGFAELAACGRVVLAADAVGEDEQEGEQELGAAHLAMIRQRGPARRD
jgi:hypothetical protein